jgi:hypothetical protein
LGTASSAVSPWISSGTVTSPEARHALGAAFQASATSAIAAEVGVLPGGGSAANAAFVPTSNGTASAPRVSVAPGKAIVQSALGHVYECTLDAAANVLLDTPLPASGLTRIDVLCGRVLDTEADGGGTAGTFQLITVTGTSAASPAVPTVPSGYLPLYRMTLANSGSISNITSVRTWARATGAPRLVEVGDVVAGAFPGDLRRFADGRVDAWTGSAWITTVAPAAWTQVNAAYVYAGGGGGTCSFGSTGTSICRYKRAGNDLTVSYEARWAGTGINMGTGNITTVLPQGWVTPTGRDQILPCHIWVNDSVSGVQQDWAGLAFVLSGSNILRPYFPWNIGDQATGIAPYKVANDVGVPGFGVPYVKNGSTVGFPQGSAAGGSLHVTGLIELAP